jgi:uncharacterized protein YecT (DUF1311 family)
MIRYPFFLAVLTFAPTAFAAPNPCENASTQLDLNTCSAQEYQTADKALNDAYQAYREQLSEAGRSGLRKAQRAWIAFRDAECEFQASAVEGGSAQPMVRNSCLTDLSRQRATTLTQKMECPEGDLSCPH